jgi:hypothetical protein
MQAGDIRTVKFFAQYTVVNGKVKTLKTNDLATGEGRDHKAAAGRCRRPARLVPGLHAGVLERTAREVFRRSTPMT